MSAKILNREAPGGKRQKLQEILPLDTPIVVQVFPIAKCNFKCNYCWFNIPKDSRHWISDTEKMDFKCYVKFINDLLLFPKKIKILRIVGLGEPLIYPDVINIIKYAKLRDVAEKVEIITNGSLLTKKMSDELVYWVDRIVISVQGISSEAYKKISNVKIDFEKFVENIAYFYKLKQEKNPDCHLYIKVADIALKEKEDKKFYKIFKNICDSMSIEQIVPMHPGIKYEKNVLDKTKTQFGLDLKEVERCPTPFMGCQVNPDGNVTVCWSWEYPIIVGNVLEESIVDIWKSKKFNKFRKSILNRNKNDVCKKCTMSLYRRFEEDMINDENVKRLLKEYK